MPPQFGDALDVDAFGGISYTDEASQSVHSYGHFSLCWRHLQRTDYVHPPSRRLAARLDSNLTVDSLVTEMVV